MWFKDSLASGAAIAILSAATSATFIINLCEAVFRCGCRSWWNGAAAACNIHRAGVRHCPLCTIGMEGFLTVLLAVIAVQTVAAFAPLPWMRRLLLALILFPVTGGLISLALGLYEGYWH